MNRLLKYFLQGLLLVGPLGVTLYIIFLIFTFMDNLLKAWILKIFGFGIPGLGLIIIVFFLVLIGFLGQTIIAQPFRALLYRLLDKAPIVKVVYTALQDLFSAFVGQERKFNKPVLVLVNPVTNLEKLGFVTEEDLSKLELSGKVAVYFPHSYNFSGELFIVPSDQVKRVNLSPAEVMKFIVSGGVAGWDDDPAEPQ